MDYKSLGDYYYSTEPIGHGSFSLIFKGYRIKDRKPVAVKKFTKYIDKKYVDSEINLMKDLDNNNILKLYEVIRTSGNLYLILEYCNNGDLSKYIKKKNNDNDYFYIFQIILGLKYLYNNNILHRDIKPQNVLLHNNTIKICDFGFAKEFYNNDLINTFCGSPLYMAPEILKVGEYTEKSDIWSLGVIIYEILFKEHPYPCKNHKDLINKIKNVDNNLDINIINLDEDLKFLLSKMLEKNPIDRISWNTIFKSKWFLEFDYKKISNNLEDNNTDENKLLRQDKKLFFNDNDIDDDNMIFNIDDIDTNKSIINEEDDKIKLCRSLSVKKNKSDLRIVSRSFLLDRNDIQFNIQDDTKVYSRSAPNNNNYNQSIIYENYICNKIIDSINEPAGYKILGESPKINGSSGWINSLNKSVNTIKNFFNL